MCQKLTRFREIKKMDEKVKRNEEQKSKDQPAATLRTGNPIVKKKKTLEEEWETCERAYVSGHDSSSNSEDDGYQRNKDQEVAKSATEIGGNLVTDKGVIFYACNAVCLFDFFIIVIILF